MQDHSLFSNSATTQSSRWTIALAIFVVAFAARLIFLLNSPDRAWPHSAYYEGDAIIWVEWARAIDEGGAFQFDLPIHPPAIAYAMAYSYHGIHTVGFLGMKVLWCAMSALGCVLTFLACDSVMNRRVAVLASLMLSFSFGQYVLATSLNNETPYLMLLPAIVLLTQRAIIQPQRWTIVALGVLHGLGLLLRAEHPLLLLFFLLWMLCARPPRSAAASFEDSPHRPRLQTRAFAAASIAFVALVVCLPWSIHATVATRRFNTLEVKPIAFNLAPITWTASAQASLNALPAFARLDIFAVLNHWAQTKGLESVSESDVRGYLESEFGWIPCPLPSMVLISNQGPFSFALANHPDCDGGFSRAALAHPMRGSDPEFAFAFPPHNRVFVDGWTVGWHEITSDPRAWIRLVGRKFQRFADGVTCGFGAANLPLNRWGIREPVDMFVSDAPFARWWQSLMLLMIAAGIVLALVRRIPSAPWLLIILYKIIITIFFYGYARQGASIAPAFYIFIAMTIDTLLLPLDRHGSAWVRRQPRIVMVVCLCMLIGDLMLSRRNERVAIHGETVARPEFGCGQPAAFQAFNRIELRDAVP